MPDSQVEEVKSKINIVDIIGEHVQLNKSGSNYKGLCPFHQEKSPSFMVSSELQIYKCFGCGEGGDVFTFLEKYEGMEFSEALKYLADKVGVKLVSTNPELASEKDVLYEINNLAAKFYNYLLTSHPVGKIALNYLQEERKITEDSIKLFNIGFAPANKNSLSDFLIKKKKFKVKDLEKAGIIFVSKSGSIYDRFEGRIIFPISDHRGNSIALAGRLIPPGKPNVGKYINSPETLIYHKSSSLYGLNITKDFIKKEGFAVVSEGEIDLISSYQAGVKNIVAIKGSAFTDDQSRLLGRYTKEVVLALDTDFAGIEASLRGIKILQNNEFEIRVAKLGIYKDPDEAVKANPEFYKEQISKSIGIWDFIIDAALDRFDKNTASGKTKIGKFLTPILSQIDNKILQDHYIKKLAKLLDVNPNSVSEEVGKVVLRQPSVTKKEDQKLENKKPILELREEEFLGLILKVKPSLIKDEKIINLIQTPFLKKLITEFKVDDFGKSLPKEIFERFSEIVLSVEDDKESEMKTQINTLYKFLSLDLLKQKLMASKDQDSSSNLQKQYKDFDSDVFERIIA
ncbi:hypothetical protein BH10PAT1_BH10PAT1_7480 [soil metagenome]